MVKQKRRRGQERVLTSWVLSIKAIGSAPMPGKEFLREQIERARRLARALTRTEDRDRLLAVAEDYQSQLDATSSVQAQAEQAVPDERSGGP
jgi:hypothetical protein